MAVWSAGDRGGGGGGVKALVVGPQVEELSFVASLKKSQNFHNVNRFSKPDVSFIENIFFI